MEAFERVPTPHFGGLVREVHASVAITKSVFPKISFHKPLTVQNKIKGKANHKMIPMNQSKGGKGDHIVRSVLGV